MPESAATAATASYGSPHLRLVFLGSGAFGISTFKVLRQSHEVALVITQPDRPAGRRRTLTPTPIGQIAQRHSMSVIKPENVNDPGVVEQVRATKPDVMVVIAYGQKIGTDLRRVAPMINLHGSLLPKFRGAAPIQWAVMRGETTTGVTVIDVADRMDAGAMYGSAMTPIDPMETAGELHDRLAELGPQLMLDVLKRFQQGTATSTPQDESAATRAPKLNKAMGTVHFDQPAAAVRAWIHGLTPWPGCTVLLGDHPVKLLRVCEVSGATDGEPGSLTAEGVVACGPGAIRILSIQTAGGKAMSFEAFCRGHELPPGARLQPVAPQHESSS